MMKKRFIKTMALIVVAAIALSSIFVLASADDAELSTFTGRFTVHDMDAPEAEFSMISEDGELIIHIHEDTTIDFEDYVPASEEEGNEELTTNVREVLFGRTLEEVLEGRNLVVTYAVETRSLPPQTTPISIVVLFETAVPLPAGGELGTELESVLPFEDVNPLDWFYNAVVWAYANGIMNGINETTFAPEASMTRAMLVTVLWRYAGSPDVDGESQFDDVASDRWYTEAIAWAAENGIVLGVSETAFAPNEQITREQMYTVLYRYVEFAEIEIALEDEMRLREFADQDDVSEWALDAMFFMFDAGIMFRESSLDNYARPRENAPRGEIAGAMFFLNMRAQQAADAADADDVDDADDYDNGYDEYADYEDEYEDDEEYDEEYDDDEDDEEDDE